MTIFSLAYHAKYKARKRRSSQSVANPWERVLALSEFDDFLAESQKLARKLAIPATERGTTWFKFLQAGHAKQRHAWLFEFLVQVDSTQFAERIERDVTRTLGKRTDLSAEELIARQNSIRRVLIAYSNLDASLGYCQGMNFIASHILEHIPDEIDAFWMFVAVLRRTRNLFCNGLEGFFQATEIFDEIFQQILPDLFAHFTEECADSKMFLTSWFHTLFVFGERPVVDRIWDNFLLSGSEFAIRVSLANLIILKDELMSMSIIEIVTYLKHPPITNPQQLVDVAFSFEIPSSFKQNFCSLDEEYPLSNYFTNIPLS